MVTPNEGLNDLISNTESIATDLSEFRPYVPVEATIPALLSELYAISASLQDLHIASTNPRNFHDSRYYADARWAVVEALKRTLQDLDRFIKRRKDIRSGRSRRESYLFIWGELNEFFFEQDNYILFDRLNCFKLFLRELVLILKGNRESFDFQTRYDRIDKLVEIQDEDLSHKLRRLELERDAIAVPTKVKSWERRRPRPRTPVTPAPPVSPPGLGGLWDTAPDLVPPAPPPAPPSPPKSTTSTASPSAGSSPSLVVPNMAPHWLKAAFTQSRPTTYFSNTSAASALFSEHMSKVTDTLSKNGYAERLILHFDNSIEVRIYIREKDHKARIYCKDGSAGRRTISCRPITKLHINRQDANLQLYELDKDRGRIWLILRFPSYERMLLFFCTFLALKMEDESPPPDREPDGHILLGEKHAFSCSIYDNHYKHALQIFKDDGSDGIRLTASIMRGEKKRVPVWTSFINYKISAIKWNRRVEPRKIHLADLPRFVFTNDYTPHMGPNGEHEIQFDEAKDADEFMRIVNDLATGRFEHDT